MTTVLIAAMTKVLIAVMTIVLIAAMTTVLIAAMTTVLIAAMTTVLIAAMTAAMIRLALAIVDTEKIPPSFLFYLTILFLWAVRFALSLQLGISYHEFLPIHVLIFDLVYSS